MTTEFMLQYSGVSQFLDVLVTNEDVDHPKPAPDGYLLAMEKLDSNAENTVVVEDGMHGIQAAKAAGARVVEVKDPTQVSLEILERIIGQAQ